MSKYTVTKKFLAGNLEGLFYVFKTDSEYKIGDVFKKSSINPSPYIIVAIQPNT
jgi:hypothetical protein